MSDTLALTRELIARASVTPDDAGCMELIGARLRRLGFELHPLRFGEVDNLWARRGNTGPLFAFAGHTDVVPPGPLAQWTSPPFSPDMRDGHLYGRGAADMKGSIAAMIVAVERFLAKHPQHDGSIAFLLTSDEEGPSINGTVKVVEWLQARGERIDWCVVGEPTSVERLGDTIKNGRRGSLNGNLVVHGVQGHAAYPDRADNPIHRAAPVLAELCAIRWDHGNEHFPPTTFQISNIHAGTGADNVIPGTLEVIFNLRYSTELTREQIERRIENVLLRHGLRYTLTWRHSGAPFLTPEGKLVDATRAAIAQRLSVSTELSTSGGTSDGRFIAPTGAEVLELGPINASIHKIDERVAVADLDALSDVYEGILRRLLK